VPAHPKNADDLAARVAELEAERALMLRLARADSLTGLLNRAAFTGALGERLAMAQAYDEQLALFIIDIDRFKHLNESLGHTGADLLLAELGARLAADCARGELAGRLGGDEFVLATPDLDVARRAERLLELLSQPFAINGRTIAPAVSVGAAVGPQDSAEAGELQHFADRALARAKARGGRRWSAFDAELRAEDDRRRSLERELRRAIPAGEIEPWFQPVVDSADGRTVGVEVLCRWRHPEQGLLAPAAFVPVAEELGLIGRIDEAVFETACAMTAPWVAQGLISSVSCNVSPRDLIDPAFSRRLIHRLTRTDLPPTALTVEITETFLLQDMALARRHIERLAAKGVHIALDDFGTGYSNLRALMNLPIQTVKLDRSLIDDIARHPRVAKLVSSMMHAARALGVSVVAEGVEDEAQAIILRAAGCDRMQGYWFARPMNASAMEQRLLEERTAHRPPFASAARRIAAVR
jgi:diguanylate cyclase (GGDEF)-like protein